VKSRIEGPERNSSRAEEGERWKGDPSTAAGGKAQLVLNCKRWMVEARRRERKRERKREGGREREREREREKESERARTGPGQSRLGLGHRSPIDYCQKARKQKKADN